MTRPTIWETDSEHTNKPFSLSFFFLLFNLRYPFLIYNPHQCFQCSINYTNSAFIQAFSLFKPRQKAPSPPSSKDLIYFFFYSICRTAIKLPCHQHSRMVENESRYRMTSKSELRDQTVDKNP